MQIPEFDDEALMRTICLLIVLTYVWLVLTQQPVPDLFDKLVTFVLGYYFNSVKHNLNQRLTNKESIENVG